MIDNHPRFIVLSYPDGGRLPKGWVWKGKKVSIYFWRREDAGYVFDSYVIDDLANTKRARAPGVAFGGPAADAEDASPSGRARSIPAYLYLLKRIEGAYEKPERAPGLRCLVQDLSEDGARPPRSAARPCRGFRSSFNSRSRSARS